MSTVTSSTRKQTINQCFQNFFKFAFKDCIWTGPYIVSKVLSNNNYVIRRTGTKYTQTLQKIRLWLYAPNQRVPEVTVRGEDYLPDPEVKTTHHDDDWYAQAMNSEIFCSEGLLKVHL